MLDEAKTLATARTLAARNHWPLPVDATRIERLQRNRRRHMALSKRYGYLIAEECSEGRPVAQEHRWCRAFLLHVQAEAVFDVLLMGEYEALRGEGL
jgi:hypothetical protein